MIGNTRAFLSTSLHIGPRIFTYQANISSTHPAFLKTKVTPCVTFTIKTQTMKCIRQGKSLITLLLLFVGTTTWAQEEIREKVEVPEPLNFDLVRGLGAIKGELEINALAEFPFQNFSNTGIDWAPEIEYALFDGFAVELELPMNNGVLEAYKAAIQYTIGQPNDRFIHGIQVMAESFVHKNLTELNLLYIPAFRFNEVWSAIGLFGFMLEFGNERAARDYTMVLNASVFANLNKHWVLGLEFNNTNTTLQKIDNNEMILHVLPQAHYEMPNGLSIQFGIGPKFDQGKTDTSAILRLIKTF